MAELRLSPRAPVVVLSVGGSVCFSSDSIFPGGFDWCQCRQASITSGWWRFLRSQVMMLDEL
jgi:hypothetical protein